jgi:D-specific alpha-keto acid dehydrogenase
LTGTRGITVYGCETDESDLFNALSPRFGIIPTTTSVAVSETNVIPLPKNRCISVGHKSEIGLSITRATASA